MGARELLAAGGHRVAVELVELSRAGPSPDAPSASLAVKTALAPVVGRSLAAGRLPIVLAGSCDASLGVLAGFDHSRCGVVWIDAHADFNTPESSVSGFFPGMSTAAIAGHCHADLWSQAGDSTPIPEEHIVRLGTRELSPEAERDRLEHPAVRVVAWHDGVPLGDVDVALDERAKRVDEVYLHVDNDALDPRVAPGVVGRAGSGRAEPRAAGRDRPGGDRPLPRTRCDPGDLHARARRERPDAARRPPRHRARRRRRSLSSAVKPRTIRSDVDREARPVQLERLMVIVGIAGCLAAMSPAVAQSQAGALDDTFSGDGKQLTDATSGRDYAVDVAVQPADGKIVAAGLSGGRIALIRYDTDGSLDQSFGGDGKVVTNLSAGSDWVGGVELQPDGRIVVAGRSGNAGGSFAVVRYNTDGTLDATFSGDGKATVNFSPGDDFAFGVALQADGKIVAAGRAGGAGGRLALVRFMAGGGLDPTFSGDGRAAINLTPGDDRLDHVVLQASGRIVAAGTADYDSRRARFAVIRLEADGMPDSTFGGDGRVTTNLSGGVEAAFGVGVDSHGKIVACGQAGLSIGLVRYDDDGTLDTTFSGDGKAMTNLTSGLDYAEEIEIQTDDKIIVAGTANYFGNNARSALARYETTGALDTGFSGDGKVVTDMTPGFDAAYGLALEPGTGKIVTAGYGSGRGGRFAIGRYLGV